MQALYIALTSILLFPLPAIPSALPSSSSISNPFPIPPPTADHLALPTVATVAPEAEGRIICFNITTERVFPVDVSDCDHAIEDMLRDPSGVMTRQTFSHNPQTPGIFAVPRFWEYGRCFVLLTSEDEDEVREFRLIDAIVRAQDVLAKCPPISKHGLGGIGVLGIGNFFVTVDGPPYGRLNQTMQLGRDSSKNLDLNDIGSS